MELPEDVRERYRAFGRTGGRARARNLAPRRRTEIARRAATARWVLRRFGASQFADLALPGGDVVDEGLADLASGRTSAASLLVSLAAPRLRREGVPVTNTQPDPELRLYRLLSSAGGDLGYARYNAHLRLIVSFADACSVARSDARGPARGAHVAGCGRASAASASSVSCSASPRQHR